MRTRLSLTQLEDKVVPATISLSGGVLTYDASPGIANNVTISVSGDTYTIKDTGETITMASGLAFSRGTGTNTVTGKLAAGVTSMRFDLGDGDDTINVRSISVPLSITTGSGTNAVNVSSNAPVNTGNLSGILGGIDVDGAGGDTTLVVSASTQTTIPGAVSIDADSIDGLLPSGYSLTYTSLSSARLLAPSSLSLAKTFTIDSPSCPFRFDLGQGQNTVSILGSVQPVQVYAGLGGNTFNVLGDATGVIQSGSGSDTFYVAPGVTWDGDIRGGWGADVWDIQGTVTGYRGV